MDLVCGTGIITPQTEQRQRMSIFLWGAPGIGKTVFACTAPGDILLINFDPDGYTSVNYRNNVAVIDLSVEGKSCIELLKQDQPQIRIGGKLIALSTLLKENPNIKTLVVDSITALLHQALKLAIDAPAIKKQAGAMGISMEAPTTSGWTARNMYIQQIMSSLLQITGAFGVNCIFIGHATEEKDKEGHLLGEKPNMGTSLLGAVAGALSEIWPMVDNGRERKIMFRANRNMKPAKTRMFLQSTVQEVIIKYNADTQTGEGIAEWYDLWKQSKFTKINPPK